jgi:hypothetical protein
VTIAIIAVVGVCVPTCHAAINADGNLVSVQEIMVPSYGIGNVQEPGQYFDTTTCDNPALNPNFEVLSKLRVSRKIDVWTE